MDINSAIIFLNETFKDLMTLLNSYAQDQFARLETRVSCEFYFEIGHFTMNIAVDLSNSKAYHSAN